MLKYVMLGIRKFDLLVSIYIFCILVSELMGAKTVPIIKNQNINGSVALLTLPIIFTINDIITEVHGKERARSVIKSSFIVIVLLMIFSAVATFLPPSKRFEPNEKAYDTIFGLSIRMSAASLLSFIFADLMDIIIFVKIRQALGKSKLWLRNNASNFIAQFIDTVTFITLAFYALDKPFSDNFGFLIGVILPYWFLKCTMSVIETPFVYLGVKWLKNENHNDEKQK